MFSKLLCIAPLAGVTLAQGISITEPVAKSKVAAGKTLVVQVERPPPADIIQDVSIVIAAANCQYGCPSALGHGILYSGAFNPTSVNAKGKYYQNFTVTAPDYFVGEMQINAAHFYLDGLQNTAELEFANVTVTLTGATG